MKPIVGAPGQVDDETETSDPLSPHGPVGGVANIVRFRRSATGFDSNGSDSESLQEHRTAVAAPAPARR